MKKFGQQLRTLLGALKAANLSIDAVEFGNEDDSYYYDAYVPNRHNASQTELHTWLHGYGEFLKTGAEILHDAKYYPQAKMIAFGIAHGYIAAGRPPQNLSNPAQVVAILKNVDGTNYIDNADYRAAGYGTHIYASPANAGQSGPAHCARTYGLWDEINLCGLQSGASRTLQGFQIQRDRRQARE